MTDTKISTELLPCPLCGSAFKMGQEPNDNHPVGGMFYLYHDYGPLGSAARQCPLEINRHFVTEDAAIAAWNTRSPQPAHEPTAAMIEAGLRVDFDNEDERATVINVWQAMSAAAALTKQEGSATHRHKKRGTEYVLIGIGRMQAKEWLSRVQPVDGTGFGFSGNALMPVDMREVAIYRSATDPTEIWVRPREEFEDGRFATLSDTGGEG